MVMIPDGGDGGGIPSVMMLEVAPEELLATAKDFEAAANKLQNWLLINGEKLNFDPPGADQVSINMAQWFNDNVNDSLGAIPAGNKAAQSLRNAALDMRAAAKEYGLTDGGTAATVAAASA